MSTPAFALHSAGSAPREQLAQADGNLFEASVANLTVRAAFTHPTSLSRPELFGLLLLMSVPREAATQISMQGGKP